MCFCVSVVIDDDGVVFLLLQVLIIPWVHSTMPIRDTTPCSLFTPLPTAPSILHTPGNNTYITQAVAIHRSHHRIIAHTRRPAASQGNPTDLTTARVLHTVKEQKKCLYPSICSIYRKNTKQIKY